MKNGRWDFTIFFEAGDRCEAARSHLERQRHEKRKAIISRVNRLLPQITTNQLNGMSSTGFQQRKLVSKAAKTLGISMKKLNEVVQESDNRAGGGNSGAGTVAGSSGASSSMSSSVSSPRVDGHEEMLVTLPDASGASTTVTASTSTSTSTTPAAGGNERLHDLAQHASPSPWTPLHIQENYFSDSQPFPSVSAQTLPLSTNTTVTTNNHANSTESSNVSQPPSSMDGTANVPK